MIKTKHRRPTAQCRRTTRRAAANRLNRGAAVANENAVPYLSIIVDVLEPIKTVERLLRRYGNTGHADIAAKTLQHISSGVDLGVLVTLDWWGGSGSIADVHLSREPWNQGRATEEMDAESRDRETMRSALVRIHSAMEAAGVECARAAFWASHFNQS